MTQGIPIHLPRRPVPTAASAASSGSNLACKLAAVLPKPHRFHIYHISTPPTRTDALCSAPPGERDDKTYVEKHFLSVTIDIPAPKKTQTGSTEDTSKMNQVIVLGIEIFIFTTAYLSVYFVSKADSTGYLHLLELSRGTPSPIREVSSTFLSHLVHTHYRPGKQSVISLFARSQAQYLFPGSVENDGKHVLDDRGLVRWWCRVLNPMLEPETRPPGSKRDSVVPRWSGRKAYLIVPGLDDYETRAFIPRPSNAPSSNPSRSPNPNWILGHPLNQICHYTHEYDWVPPRCLVPRFPDDPKSRFLDELDEEAHSTAGTQTTGAWKSVRSLDQFWEMMSFRQECSAGRMTGFIWVVFDPPSEDAKRHPATSPPNGAHCSTSTPTASDSSPENPSPRKSIPGTPVKTPRPAHAEARASSSKRRTKRLAGPIHPRTPRIKTHRHAHLTRLPTATAYYAWPEAGRGAKLVDEKGYEGINKLLLKLDFANLEIAAASTARWIRECGMGEDDGRGRAVCATGCWERREGGVGAEKNGDGARVNSLNGLVKRKREDSEANGQAKAGGNGVNVLGGRLVRKKMKVASDEGGAGARDREGTPKVNVLSAGMVRKKPKA